MRGIILQERSGNRRRFHRSSIPGRFDLRIYCTRMSIGLCVLSLWMLISISCTTQFAQFDGPKQQTKALKSITNQDYLQRQYHVSLLLTRLRRQATSNTGQQQTALGSTASGTAGGINGQLEAGQTSASGDQAEAQPEILANLKCDFGTADSPDLCKFKILDQDSMNPLARTSTLASWTLGSGRLALFQGGPLLDATGLQSGSNETNGGYIFYETSNPFTISSANLTHSIGIDSGYGGAMTSAHSAVPHMQHHQKPTNMYSSDQVLISQRFSVAPTSMTPNIGSLQVAGPSFFSPNLTAPGPSGMCLAFQYAIQGLSAEELRIYLSDQKTGRTRQIWSSSESAASNWTKGEVLYSVTNQHSLVFSAINSNAIAKDSQQRKFRGHLALDDIDIQKHDPSGGEHCKGHCNFDGDSCGWTNGENGQDDDFDWTFGRGSDNLFTGPARDFTSSSNNELTGSFLFTDSGYPRRPGDRALLLSPMFQPTAINDAMCMRFAVHMFGSGIGSLAIKLRYADESAASVPATGAGGTPGANPNAAVANPSGQSASPQQFAPSSRASDSKPGGDLVVWEMSGDAGNSWHQAQTSVSSSKSPFQVLIEGMIGENHLGNIAIDEISFSQGPCPTSPPVASKNYGDCTFEQSMCYWRNPDADIHLDDLDWVRQADETSIHGPNFDHTLKKRSGSYLKLENTFREPKSGTRAFLLSPVFSPKASGSVQCLSFYYYMFMRSISSSGPNLGTIRVYLASNNELVPIWRLTNPISSPNWKHARASLSTAIIDGQPQAPTKLFQIAFEGIWGDAASGAIALDDITVFDGACDIMPSEARSVPGECTFDVDMCSWSNKTASYEMGPNGQMLAPGASAMATSSHNDAAALDSNRSPFLQSVGSTGSGSNSGATNLRLTSSSHHSSRLRALSGWQLATVDSRPVNLQDHTYKAPIGYAYVDVLDSNGSGSGTSLAYPLQSAEVTVQSGQQFMQCLSFWFAAYGRLDTNQLGVYLTQASAPPPNPEDSASGASSGTGQAVASSTRNQGQTGASVASSSDNSGAVGSEAEQANAWKTINGKLLWNVALRNVTESYRRKWLYGQVTVRADSNHIVRFVTISNDGGFALDDVSYFPGACETRPSHARVQSVEDEAAELASFGGASGTGQSDATGTSSGTGGGSTNGNTSSGGSAAVSANNIQRTR